MICLGIATCVMYVVVTRTVVVVVMLADYLPEMTGVINIMSYAQI